MTDRVNRLREVAQSLGADAAIVTHPANRRYFSGFPAEDHAPDEVSAVLLVTNQEAVLLTSPTNLPWARAAVRPPVEARAWERPWPVFLGRALQGRDIRQTAFEDRALSVADFRAIEETGATLVPAGNAFHAVRAIKDSDEIAAIAEAARITDATLTAAIANLRPGISERELAWRIEMTMRELGADGPAFPTCVAAGPNGARPHHDPSDRELAEGEPIVIDLGARVRGYCGDLTRTIVIGDPPPNFADRYNSVLAAQSAALRGIRAGMTGRDADDIARAALGAEGFGDRFIHGLGHGVGLLIHEYPSVGTQSDDRLVPGHVITIEPGIYFEGWGGIRIEDLCVVTPSGLDVLSHAPK